MMKCIYCNKEITSQNDLTLGTTWFDIITRPYHVKCFNTAKKSSDYLKRPGGKGTSPRELNMNIFQFFIIVLVFIFSFITRIFSFLGLISNEINYRDNTLYARLLFMMKGFLEITLIISFTIIIIKAVKVIIRLILYKKSIGLLKE